MKRGDRVLVQGYVLTVQDGIATVEFAGTYPKNGQRIRIATEALEVQETPDPADPVFHAPGNLEVFRRQLAEMRAETGGTDEH